MQIEDGEPSKRLDDADLQRYWDQHEEPKLPFPTWVGSDDRLYDLIEAENHHKHLPWATASSSDFGKPSPLAEPHGVKTGPQAKFLSVETDLGDAAPLRKQDQSKIVSATISSQLEDQRSVSWGSDIALVSRTSDIADTTNAANVADENHDQRKVNWSSDSTMVSQKSGFTEVSGDSGGTDAAEISDSDQAATKLLALVAAATTSAGDCYKKIASIRLNDTAGFATPPEPYNVLLSPLPQSRQQHHLDDPPTTDIIVPAAKSLNWSSSYKGCRHSIDGNESGQVLVRKRKDRADSADDDHEGTGSHKRVRTEPTVELRAL